MDVAAIMPCRGRVEQTITNVRRLLAAAGYEGWGLHLITDDDAMLTRALFVTELGGVVHLDSQKPQSGYWRCLAKVTEHTAAPLLVNLANDLIPGRHWLKRGVDAYRARFGDGDGLMGFNDGLHGPEHSSHFLISRALLDRYGGWPIQYQHNFGDTEICRRAQQDGCYGKAPWAVLFHDHVENGAGDDEVYREGRASYERDARLFEERRKAGWR
jgi:hypothetical protein